MFHVVLLEPEIPQNTGNIIRLCANTGATLHLIRPIGFRLDDRQLKRAGLDYHEWTELRIHESYSDFLKTYKGRAIYGFSTRGARSHTAPAYHPGDVLLFGPETRGLPDNILAPLLPDNALRIPMRAGSRSINLSNSVAIALYEAWRQLNFQNAG